MSKNIETHTDFSLLFLAVIFLVMLQFYHMKRFFLLKFLPLKASLRMVQCNILKVCTWIILYIMKEFLSHLHEDIYGVKSGILCRPLKQNIIE